MDDKMSDWKTYLTVIVNTPPTKPAPLFVGVLVIEKAGRILIEKAGRILIDADLDDVEACDGLNDSALEKLPGVEALNPG